MAGSRRNSRRNWGWHELERRWAERLVDQAEVRPGDLVLDVGAGTGNITAALLRAGATVVAVELHPGRARHLRQRFDGQPVTVVQAGGADLRLPRRPFDVVSNPPFAITGPLLRRLLTPRSRLQSAVVVCQQQVAVRWAGPKAPGLGRWGADFTVQMGGVVPRRAFRPPPQVNSQALVINRQRGRADRLR